MAGFLPKWLFGIYCKLWVKKRYSWFNFQEAQKITGIKQLVKLSKAFSIMKSKEWIIAEKDKANPRKRKYKLVEIHKIIFDLAKAK